ncbi:MAG: hypothetical protein IT553_07820 [Sphingomonadaceae bacterium]|nr:hypothetical protein [Sphingomonadaceae bacterium]
MQWNHPPLLDKAAHGTLARVDFDMLRVLIAMRQNALPTVVALHQLPKSADDGDVGDATPTGGHGSFLGAAPHHIAAATKNSSYPPVNHGVLADVQSAGLSTSSSAELTPSSAQQRFV